VLVGVLMELSYVSVADKVGNVVGMVDLKVWLKDEADLGSVSQ
jgi:hypothetical protein